jgi:serine/threonine-protein kinase
VSSGRPDLSGNRIASKFKLHKRLGQGHFGDVYLGEHTVVGREFALKVIPVSPSNYDASALEAKLLNLSSHPHIVEVRSAEYWRNPKGEDFCLIEMEYVEGGNLQDMISADAPIGDLLEVMKNVLFGLDHAHSLDVIHRDVKPANILLGAGGKLSDFGIAMVSASGASASEYIYGGNLAPEAQKIPREFTRASDIFAAGLTLLRGLNLIQDWGAERTRIPNFADKMKSGAFVGELGFHARVPGPLKKIVRKACAIAPEKRYPSAAAFRDALERLKVLRNWRRTGATTWECTFNGTPERLDIRAEKKGFAVDYYKGSRRHRGGCRSNMTEAAANKHVAVTIAETTLA